MDTPTIITVLFEVIFLIISGVLGFIGRELVRSIRALRSEISQLKEEIHVINLLEYRITQLEHKLK
jgi:hypothetical protein